MLNSAQGKYCINNMKDIFSNLFQIRSLLSPHQKVKNSFILLKGVIPIKKLSLISVGKGKKKDSKKRM